MENLIGSRGYAPTDFTKICAMSGTDVAIPLQIFKNSLLIEHTLVDYSFEYLSLKINLTNRNQDIIVTWTTDTSKYYNAVYAKTIKDDIDLTCGILKAFKTNYLRGLSDNEVFRRES